MHRLTWYRAGQDRVHFRDYFLQALIDSGAMVTLQDPQGRYIFMANLPAQWRVEGDQDPTDESLYGVLIGGHLTALKSHLTHTPGPLSLEQATEDGRIYRFTIHAATIGANDEKAPDGPGRHFLTSIADLTEERRTQAALSSALRELNHRSKNLLAIVQSLANMSARHTDRLDHFLVKYRGRIAALAAAQDLITDADWRGARFFDLVQRQIDAFATCPSGAVRISGENLLLPPPVALHIGLALHELIVNAAIHGAAHGDRVGDLPVAEVCLSTLPRATGEVEMLWREPMSNPALRSGAVEAQRWLGATILELVVPTAVGGHADYCLKGGEVRYGLRFMLAGT